MPDSSSEWFRFGTRSKTRGLVQLVTNLVRLRAVQLTAAAALLLSMVQMGRMITGESMTPTVLEESGLSKSAPGARRDSTTLVAKTDTRGRGADQLASTSAPASGVLAPPPAPPAQDKPETESPLPVTVYSADVFREHGSKAPTTRRTRSRMRTRPVKKKQSHWNPLQPLPILPPTANLSETRRLISRSLASKKRFRKSPVLPRKTKATSRRAAPKNKRTAS